MVRVAEKPVGRVLGLGKETCTRCLTVCVLQGASEGTSQRKEKVEKGNENYQNVKEVRTCLHLRPVFQFGFTL